MKYLIFFLSFSVSADTYLDLGIEFHNNRDSFWQRDGVPIQNPIGTVELGYEKDNYSIYYRHHSSIPQEDTGLNTIGIKFRVLGK